MASASAVTVSLSSTMERSTSEISHMVVGTIQLLVGCGTEGLHLLTTSDLWHTGLSVGDPHTAAGLITAHRGEGCGGGVTKSKKRVPVFQGLISKRTSLISAMFYSLGSKSLGPAHTRESSQEDVRYAYHML